ncbi:MAG: sulfatase [Bacteroidales bacterium]|nr:sulfatase [Bacteroidales bacterium]MBN2697895.1 sulfatase [Bacteroidales bacterium]
MQYLYIFAISVLCLLSCNRADRKEDHFRRNDDRPNIVFIMTDDHGFQALSAYDSTLIRTPNLDRVAREGIRFDRAFVSNSICAPSRAVLLTGKFSHLNSVRDNVDIFDTAQVTFPGILHEHGYETAIFGKWHLKSQPTGFDYWKVLPDQGQYYHPEFLTPGGIVKEEGYATDIITDLAIHYLDSLRDKSKPFLLMVHHKAPHREWLPPLEYLDAFHNRNIPEPPTLFDDYRNRGTAARSAEMRIADHMALSSDNKIDPENIARKEFLDWYQTVYYSQYNRLSDYEKKRWDAVYGPVNEEYVKMSPEGDDLMRWKYRRYMEDYLGTIRSVDDNVGRLLAHLDELGLAGNTLVVYTSDQGFYLGEHGWFDKRFMYEPSFRTPLLIRWPEKIEGSRVSRDLVQNIDFAPTLLAAAGIDAPDEMQGKSMLPLFEGGHENWRDALYYHYYEYPSIHMVKRHYGIRTERYKLIHFYYDIDEWELYDLETDPNEMNNGYNLPEYADIQQQLHFKLDSLRKLYRDSEELDRIFIEKDMRTF